MTRRVPDLEFDGPVWQLALLCEERGADGGLLIGLEVVVDEAQYERGLQAATLSAMSQRAMLYASGIMLRAHVGWNTEKMPLTLPTAASPSSTSLTLLLGFGASAMDSVLEGEEARLARRLLPTL